MRNPNVDASDAHFGKTESLDVKVRGILCELGTSQGGQYLKPEKNLSSGNAFVQSMSELKI